MPHDAGLPDPSGPLPSPTPPREFHPVAGRIGEQPLPPRPQPTLPPPPALSAAPDVWSLLLALRRRWISAVTLGGSLSAIAAAAMWFLLAPQASAFAKLQVALSEKNVLPGGHPPNNDHKTVLQTTAGQIKSRPVIQAALKRDEVKKLGLESQGADPLQAVETIEDGLTVEWKEHSELLTIVYKHPDPHVATVVANGIKEAYYDEFVVARDKARSRKISELEKALGEANQGVNLKKDSLRKMRAELGIVDPKQWQIERQETVFTLRERRQQHTSVQLKLVEARAALEVFEARVKALEGGRGRGDRTAGPDRLSREEIEEAIETAMERDSQAKRLQDLLDSLEMEIEDYKLRNFSPNYISARRARERAGLVRQALAKRRAAISERARKAAARPLPASSGGTSPASVQPGMSREEIEVMRAQLERQVKKLAEMDEKLGKEVAELVTLAARAPKEADTYNQLADEIRRDEKIVDEISARLEREKVEMRAEPRIAKYQDAQLMKKDGKKQLLATLVAPLAVLCSVCGGLALAEHRKRKVRSPSEISRGLGIRVVGAVPRMPHLERHLVGPGGESDLEGTPVMESIDAIRTRLLHEADVRSTRVVMVTSATAGEGKTTLASALASSLARAGRKTLLLDGDLRRPTVHELFEVPMQPGFSEVLLGEIEVAEAAVESPQENLYLLPAGQWDREVLLALSRDGLEGIFEKLAEEFDFIVVDSHPVLAATDALLVGRQADAVVLSVLSEVSQMPRVYAAHQQLTGLGIRVLGAVVNASNPEEVFTSPAPVAVAA